jgi:radical SAM protein with 4Fe4S-binding SPASM domain
MQFPSLVQIETTTVCNASCSFCPHSTMSRSPKERMTEEIFRKIIDEIATWPVPLPAICPFLTNEPFTDPRIYDFCEYINLKLPNCRLVFYTNASVFTEGNLEKLGKIKNIETICCSLHHFDKDQYEKDVGLPWEKTLASIRRLIDWNLKTNTVKEVKILRVQDGNAEADQKFLDFCRATFPEVSGNLSYRYNWKGDITSWHEYKDTLDLVCPRHASMTILNDGRVSLCCMDQAGEFSLGDLKQQSLLEVYNGPTALDYRSHTKRERSPCNRCNMHS